MSDFGFEPGTNLSPISVTVWISGMYLRFTVMQEGIRAIENIAISFMI